MDFRHLIVTCLFSKLRLPFDNQKVKENYAILMKKAMGSSWYPYKETAVSTYGNCGIHTWTLSFPALDTVVSYGGNWSFLPRNCSFLCWKLKFACLEL